jgi:hypothetical protein
MAHRHAGIIKLLFCSKKVLLYALPLADGNYRWIVLKNQQMKQLSIFTSTLIDHASLHRALYFQRWFVRNFS